MNQEIGLIHKIKSAVSRYKLLHFKEFNFEKREKELSVFLKDLAKELDMSLNIIKYKGKDIVPKIKMDSGNLNIVLVANTLLTNEKEDIRELLDSIKYFTSSSLYNDKIINQGKQYQVKDDQLHSTIIIISDKYLSLNSKEALGSINSNYLVSMKMNHLFQDENVKHDFDDKVEELHAKIVSIVDKGKDKETIKSKVIDLINNEGRGILYALLSLDSKLFKIPADIKNIIEKNILIEEKAVMNKNTKTTKKRFFEEDEELLDSGIAQEGIDEDIFDDEESIETSMESDDFESDEEMEDEDFESEDFEDEEMEDEDFEDEEFESEESEEMEEEPASHEDISQELDSVIASIENDIDRLKDVQDDIEEHTMEEGEEVE